MQTQDDRSYSSANQVSKRRASIIIAIVILGAALITTGTWYGLRNVTEPKTKTYSYEIENTRLISGQAKILANKNERIVFTFTGRGNTEETDVLIPGLDQSTAFSTNSIGNLEFVCDKPGTFPIQLRDEDGNTTPLATLQIDN